MNINLSLKNALVGASSQGIGYAIAEELAQCGASVTLMARNEAKLKDKVKKLPLVNATQTHKYLVVDFSSFDTYKSTITQFFEQNTIDILVNNTNGPKAGRAVDLNIDSYQAAFDLIFKTVCETTLLAIPYMTKQNYGRIINVSSISIKEAVDNLVLSNSMRSAIAAWSKTLSNELGVHNITVNNVLTGYFLTDRLSALIENEARERNVSVAQIMRMKEDEVPLKRLGNPKEYGYLVAFLASEYSSYITGANIPIDGGLGNWY